MPPLHVNPVLSSISGNKRNEGRLNLVRNTSISASMGSMVRRRHTHTLHKVKHVPHHLIAHVLSLKLHGVLVIQLLHHALELLSQLMYHLLAMSLSSLQSMYVLHHVQVLLMHGTK